MKKLLFLPILFFSLYVNAQTVTDIDGNIYNTIVINNLEWMQENLKVTRYNNGDIIPNISNATTWSNLSTSALCYYNNDSVSYDTLYGALYNGFVVTDNRNVCPVNWHVPSDTEWDLMTYSLDNTVDTAATIGYSGTTIGKALKVNNHNIWLWANSSYIPTNNSGFSALAGGVRSSTAAFGSINYYGNWWTSTSPSPGGLYCRFLYAEDNRIAVEARNNKSGYSIRCVKDFSVNIKGSNNNKDNFNVYPNPTSGQLSISLEEASTGVLSIRNYLGQLVMEEQFNNTKEFDISLDGPSGIYFLQVESEGVIITTKVVKE